MRILKTPKTFEQSFASNPKSKYWSELNQLKPDKVFKSTATKFLFNCEKCNHEFSISLANVTNNRWCPYCCNNSKKICEQNDCTDCFNKSFASHEKSIYWSNKNELIPRQVFKNCNNKFWFDCKNCSHKFKLQLDSLNKGNWCHYCTNQKLCENEECKECFNKSFASHEKSIYWNNKNLLKPRNVFISSGKPYLFDCNVCNNSFITQLDYIQRGSWCPKCKNKTELKLFNWLKEQSFNFEIQVKFDWCKNKRELPYDFLLKDHKLIIELDGRQHFQQVSNWKRPEETKIRDDFKNTSALKNGYRIIRICQEIVLYEKENWEIQLKESINSPEKLIKIGSVYEN
jgi:very-short-patch-repair endonuclease